MVPEEITNILQETENVVLTTHVRPDADALGSLLGLTDILRELEKNVLPWLEEPVPPLYDFLPGSAQVCSDPLQLKAFVGEYEGKMAVVSLDCGGRDRMGEGGAFLLKNQPFLVIDHHWKHEEFGDCRWVESDRSSTGEMAYELGIALGARISSRCAVNLYAAVSSDTGSFRYDTTSPRTLRIAAELLERGVRPGEISRCLYENYTLERLKLMELVLATLELRERGQLAVIHLTRAMLEKSGAAAGDTEGFINYPKALRSVKAAAFLREWGDNVISVSLRAKGECDVSSIARSHGGGGHRNASGFQLSGISLEGAKERLLEILGNALRDAEQRDRAK